MRKPLLIAMTAGAALTAISSAEARQGCGAGFHRGSCGHCRSNRRPTVVAVGVPRICVFYHGRGYWNGHRYWRDRYRGHGGWRCRQARPAIGASRDGRPIPWPDARGQVVKQHLGQPGTGRNT